MKLVSSALLPVVEGDLQQTVAAFVSVLRDHCKFDAQSRCSLSMITARPKLLALVARALPPEAEEFENFPPARRKMTAAEYLNPVDGSVVHSACLER